VRDAGEHAPDAALLREVIDRAGDPERYERWLELVKHARYCRRPIRLRGGIQEIDLSTGQTRSRYSTSDEPEGVLLKACGNRRAAACPPCSAVYKADAWQLVAAGLKGGKGVPETVAMHPMVFATFTAPSFGPVHTSADPNNAHALCRRRRADERCRHGRAAGCWQRHDDDDPTLGDPICPDCFDYTGVIVWNAVAPELWRRTTIYLWRALARTMGMTQKRLHGEARISYTKVAEYQRRGSIHLHAVIRLDGATRSDIAAPPPNQFSSEQLEEAVRIAAAEVTVPNPLNEPAVVWGEQLYVRKIEPHGDPTPEAAAAYLAKYATKSTEDFAPNGSATRAHIARLYETALELSELPEVSHLRLASAVESIGFHGHWSSRSRQYSTTFAALRQARVEHAKAGAEQDELSEARLDREWRYAGIGYTTAGDAWLAASAGDGARHQRTTAKLELRGTPGELG
jgi:hypothetical protein